MNQRTKKIIDLAKRFVIKYKVPVILGSILLIASLSITCATCNG